MGVVRLRRLGVCAALALAASCSAQDAAPPRVSLESLQGVTMDESPFSGQTVRVVGAQVTATQARGFYIMDSTDYGVYVYESTMQPAVGDVVDLVGSVSEYRGLTELSHIDAALSSITSSGNAELPPLVVATGDVGERHEGALVSVSGTCIQHDVGHGEWLINDASGQLVVDDLLISSSPNPLTPTYNTRYELVGIVLYSYGAFKIEPVSFTEIGFGHLEHVPEQVYVPPPPPPPSPRAAAAAADQCPSLTDRTAPGASPIGCDFVFNLMNFASKMIKTIVLKMMILTRAFDARANR